MGGDTARYYRVLYDFIAEEEAELSVYRGERLRLIDPTIQDGWVRVEVYSEPDRQGFVPISYLTPGSRPNSAVDESDIIERKFSSVGNSTMKGNDLDDDSILKPRDHISHSYFSSRVQDNSRISGNSRPEYLDVSFSKEVVGARARQSEGGQIHAGIVGDAHYFQQFLLPHSIRESPLANEEYINEVVTDGFMRNRTYFEQLMKRRTDALLDIQNSLRDVIADAKACKEENTLLSQRLSEMTQVREKVHPPQVECTEEEKLCARHSLTSPFDIKSEKTSADACESLDKHC